MDLFFIITSVVVIIISFNLHLSVVLNYDIIKNIGKLKIKLFGIPFFVSEISLIAGYFNIVRKNKKVLQIRIDFADKNFKFLSDVSEYFFKKLFISHMITDIDYSGSEACSTAIIGGYIMAIEGIVRSVAFSKMPDTTFKNDTRVNYGENKIVIGLKSGALITIFDFLWAVIRALVKRGLYGKKFRRKRKFTY